MIAHVIDLHTHAAPARAIQTSLTIAMTMPATTNATIAAWVQIHSGFTRRSSL